MNPHLDLLHEDTLWAVSCHQLCFSFTLRLRLSLRLCLACRKIASDESSRGLRVILLSFLAEFLVL